MPKVSPIPGWDNSLLVTTLKRGSIYRLPLTPDGAHLRGPIERYFQSENRFRDTAVSPDGRSIYVATDTGGLAEALSGGTTTTLQNPGAILVFTYEGGANEAVTPKDATTRRTGSPDMAPAPVQSAGLAVHYTAEQAGRGSTLYAANCVSCHGPNLVGANHGTPLSGAYFADKWAGRSVDRLFQGMRDSMPPSRPATLSDQEYIDLVAYILSVNGAKAGAVALATETDQLDLMVIETSGKEE
ncbi:c-type cytochrome [Devosia algicola]